MNSDNLKLLNVAMVLYKQELYKISVWSRKSHITLTIVLIMEREFAIFVA